LRTVASTIWPTAFLGVVRLVGRDQDVREGAEAGQGVVVDGLKGRVEEEQARLGLGDVGWSSPGSRRP
jgi:hypothetical protein